MVVDSDEMMEALFHAEAEDQKTQTDEYSIHTWATTDSSSSNGSSKVSEDDSKTNNVGSRSAMSLADIRFTSGGSTSSFSVTSSRSLSSDGQQEISEKNPEVDMGNLSLNKFDKFMALSPDTSENLSRERSREDLAIESTTRISHVEKSWYMISDRIGEVGLKFFLKMFEEHPELIKLFPFGDDSKDPNTGKLILNKRTKAHVRAHALAVMRVVGTCVAGLTSIEDLIPRLRQVGATHKRVGVQPMHYDILYRHLIRAIHEEVGPENWDQETEDAWEQAFTSISNLIKRPSTRLETEPLRDWGIAMLVACTYFMIFTPFRFAGFLYGRPNMVILLNILDGLAALVLALDLLIDFIQTRLRVHRVYADDKTRESFSRHRSLKTSIRQFIYQKRMLIDKKLQFYKTDRWVPWPSLDIKVLLSFPLQYMFVRSSIGTQVGLHWTQLFGLLRVLTAARVMHFMQCAENNAILEQKLSADRQLHLHVAKLLIKLAFILHISACTWCIIARVELGIDATEFTPSPFFPSSNVLFGSNSNVFNSYSRALHWAFVNLAGIGDVDSTPKSTLECWTTLIVHMAGALFYAVVTGNVIAILDEASKRDNKIGTDIARLSTYLNTARVSESSKGRIMKGYLMRNVLTQSDEGDPQGIVDGLDLKDDVLDTLPNYLRTEAEIFARAEVIRRREKFFSHCSTGFLVALSSSLSKTRTLLTGDYLMKQGEPYLPEFVFVESGSLQICRNQHTIKHLNRGDCVDKAWLLQPKNESADSEEYSESTDWRKNDGTPGVSIRALSPCVLLTGLSTAPEIEHLKRGYKVDFQLLRVEARSISKSRRKSKALSMKIVAKAVTKFKAR